MPKQEWMILKDQIVDHYLLRGIRGKQNIFPNPHHSQNQQQ